MEPQSEENKTEEKQKPARKVSSKSEAVHVPVTVRGQRYAAPEGRHSQQTHRRAEERVTASGHTSEKEQQVHDREATIAGITESAAEKVRHQERSKPR